MRQAPKVVTLDFETHGIEARPKYPPKPVSLALKWPDQREYKLMAWGHGDGTKAFGNNCTEKEARAEYKKARDSKYGMLFQNGMFDCDVAETHWEIPLKDDPRLTHDTMFLLFLWDPHSPSLALKESAHRLLGIAPDEQDDLKAWILANVPEAKRKPSTWGAYIWMAPYKIVRPYHKGDLTRTLGLFDWLWPRVVEAGMEEPYQREQRLMPILLNNARRGMRIAVDRIDTDVPILRAGVDKVDDWLRRKLGDINLNSDKQLGDALYDRGIVTEFKLTPKGQRGVGKKHLTIDRFKDKRVYHALTYKAQMETSIGTFLEPWRELAGKGDRIYPVWRQVKSSGGSGDAGARSGRIICSRPNFLNLPKKWKKSAGLGYEHPAWLKVPELPFIRTYALPEKGKQWGRRDYNQQEVRIFGHYEEGPVYEGFLRDPRFDMHEGVRAEEEAALVAAGLRTEFGRDDAKGTVFGAFYGQGVKGLMELLKLRDPEDLAVGQVIHRALQKAVPSIKELSTALRDLSREGRPIMTFGGRLYYVEPPAYSARFGRDMDFAYKLISYLIQGSGADVMKEAICRWHEHPGRGEDMLVTVYDEVDINLPKSAKGVKHEMTVLRDVMQGIEVSLPMLSDGEMGPDWGTLQKCPV